MKTRMDILEEMSEEEDRNAREIRDKRLLQDRNQWIQEDVAYAIETGQLPIAKKSPFAATDLKNPDVKN
jgi:hypothetical protein